MASVSKRLMQAVLSSENLHTRLVSLLMENLGVIWGGFDGWYEEDAVEEAAKLAAEAEGRVLKQIYQVAAAGARQLMGQVGAPPAGSALEDFGYPRPVDPVEVWKRPAQQYRYAISQGKSVAEALEAALSRASHIGRDNAQITKRNAQILQFRRSEKIKGYRRIIHPELSKNGVCGLCIVAADRIYSMKDLMPLHSGCKCSVAPVTKSQDPGLSLNTQDLNALYDAAGGTDMKTLKNIRVTSYEHGELGPVLVRVGDKYLGPEEAHQRQRKKKSPRTSKRPKKPEEMAQEELQSRLKIAEAQHKAYSEKLENLRAQGVPADDDIAIGFVWGLRRANQDIKKYSKLLKEAA